MHINSSTSYFHPQKISIYTSSSSSANTLAFFPEAILLVSRHFWLAHLINSFGLHFLQTSFPAYCSFIILNALSTFSFINTGLLIVIDFTKRVSIDNTHRPYSRMMLDRMVRPHIIRTLLDLCMRTALGVGHGARWSSRLWLPIVTRARKWYITSRSAARVVIPAFKVFEYKLCKCTYWTC